MVTPIKEYEAGSYYHVYNRGNRKQRIFFRTRDFERFLERYCALQEEHRITTYAFCLIDNHFHFFVRQEDVESINKLFSRLSTSHAKYMNLKYELTGSLFQRGFQSKRIVEEPHFLHTHRYIHRNWMDFLGSTPRVEPEIILRRLIGYRWSSLSQFLGGELRPGQPQCAVLEFFEMAGVKSIAQYRQFMLDEISTYQRKQQENSNLEPVGLNLGVA